MPWKPGVSKVRVTAARSNRAGAAASPPAATVSRNVSQRMLATIERMFDRIKHNFELASFGRVMPAESNPLRPAGVRPRAQHIRHELSIKHFLDLSSLERP